MTTGSYRLELFGHGPLKKRAVIIGCFLLAAVLYAYHSDYNLATGTGNLCMVLFLAANIYFPAKRIRLRYSLKNVQPYFNTLLVYHIWLHTAAFVTACIFSRSTSSHFRRPASISGHSASRKLIIESP